MIELQLVRIDPSKLYPEFLRRLRALLEDGRRAGADFWVTSGWRSYGEQDELYAQGRTTGGAIVTNGRGGQSAHHFGIAADLTRDGIIERKGLQPDWRRESYEPLKELAIKHELAWGGSWKFRDNPHVQLPGYITTNQLQPLRDRYEAKGLRAVFEYLDEKPC